MERLSHLLGVHWFGVLLVAVGLVLGGFLLATWLRRKTWSLPLLLTGAAALLVGLGTLTLPTEIGLWVGGAAFVALFGMLLVLIITGNWSAHAGYASGAVLLLGVGGAAGAAVGRGL